MSMDEFRKRLTVFSRSMTTSELQKLQKSWQQAGDPAWQLLIQRAKQVGAPESQAATAAIFNSPQLADAKIVQCLAALKSPQADVRAVAIQEAREILETFSLNATPERPFRPPVEALRPHLKHPDRGVRIDAIQLLRIWPRALGPVIPDLIACLKDSMPELKAAAAEVLGRIGRPAAAAVPDMLPLLDHPEVNVRSFVALALGPLDGIRTTTLSPDSRERNRPRDPAQKLSPTVHKSSAALARALRDPSWQVRNHAAISLSYYDDLMKPAIKDLFALFQEREPSARGAAILALMSQPDLTIQRQAIVALLHDENPTLRFVAAQWVAAMHATFDDLVETLKRKIESECENWERTGLLEALGRLVPDSSMAVSVLLSRLEDPAEPEPELILTLLAPAASSLKSASGTLQRWADHPDEAIRQAAEDLLRDL